MDSEELERLTDKKVIEALLFEGKFVCGGSEMRRARISARWTHHEKKHDGDKSLFSFYETIKIQDSFLFCRL